MISIKHDLNEQLLNTDLKNTLSKMKPRFLLNAKKMFSLFYENLRSNFGKD